MSKNLVIVESPAKAKTIEKYLGPDFKVSSSYGHISDLPSKEIGIDVDNDFKPKYIVSSDKKDIVKQLKKQASSVDTVWLASDEDREGEAIAWHLFESLKLDKAKTKRIVFREITKKAIRSAFDEPGTLNTNRVDAQQARRFLDRVVGFMVSPLLWEKVGRGLSAGRVQSVALKMIVEREREIRAFQPQEYWTVHADLENRGDTDSDKIRFEVKKHLGKAFNPVNKAEADVALTALKQAGYSVTKREDKPTKSKPSAPFITSTLQQAASTRLGFGVKKTMMMAQRLYEAGYITYMRTDSTNLSADAIEACRDYIKVRHGARYLPAEPKIYSSKSGAQEAHEAIRPTDMSRHTVNIDRDQARLYDLIWKRTLASQMSDAKLERTNVKIEANNHGEIFTASGEVLLFEGFLKVYLEGQDDDDEEQEGMLPLMKVNEKLDCNYITATERYSRAAARYTEASLVKKLEELGIGRPSTYAPTISTIINRKYVEKGNLEGQERKYAQLVLQSGKLTEKILKENTGSDKGKLVPTDIGTIVTDFLVKNFGTILDYNFTAKVEQDFDEIAEGNVNWTQMMQEFYDKFHPSVKQVEEHAERESGERILGIHPESGKPISVRLGKFGPMAQIGAADDEDKKFASLMADQNIGNITLEEALKLFLLPKNLGVYKGEEIEINNGRYGPYIKFGIEFVSIPKGENPTDITLERAQELIDEKTLADAPIAVYKGEGVQKGVGRFGPFIKWNGLFINVNKSYDFDNLSENDCFELIELKKKKEAEKLLKVWDDLGIRLEKARWGRFNLIKGKVKVEFPKGTDLDKFNENNVGDYFKKKKPKKSKSKK